MGKPIDCEKQVLYGPILQSVIQRLWRLYVDCC